MNMLTVTTATPDFEASSDLGFSVFPLPRGEKAPKMSWKRFQSEHPHPDEVAAWQGEELNMAIVTGSISDLLVIDVDSPAAQALVDKLDLPKTPISRTSNGRHYLFKYPPVEVRNKVRIKGVPLDVRGEGGFIVGPGSKHPDGTIYRWEVSPDDCDIAELPAEVVELLTEEAPNAGVAKLSGNAKYIEAGNFSFWLNRQITERIQELRDAAEGERNNTLFRVSVNLANHIAALDLDWNDIAATLKPEALAIGLSPDETSRTLESAWTRGKEAPTAWLIVAREWVYVAARDRFWSPKTRQELKPEAFSRQYADIKPTEKGTFASLLTGSGLIEKVLDFRFLPDQPGGIITHQGNKFLNTYIEPGIEPIDGDWRPFQEFLEYLIPEACERDHLTKMLAYTVRKPGKKLSYALLLQSKVHGVGKSTLVEIWRNLLGFQNTRMTNSEEMDSPYQSYLEDTLLVVLEEMNLGSGINTYGRLKALITSPTAVVNLKYQPQREVPNLMNLVFLSNLETPLLLEQQDRRYFVIDTPASRRDSAYWTQFHSWWRANLGVIRFFLDRVDLSDFQPHEAPPLTPAKERLLRQSETSLVQNLRLLIEEMPYPVKEVCKMDDVRWALRKRSIRIDSPRKLESALKSLGAKPLGQSRLSSGKANLWALANTDLWLSASHEARREAYEGPPSEEEAA
ncbi:MAG: bifunctional DNA primase/polymerase [Pseudomonadota bacterium]